MFPMYSIEDVIACAMEDEEWANRLAERLTTTLHPWRLIDNGNLWSRSDLTGVTRRTFQDQKNADSNILIQRQMDLSLLSDGYRLIAPTVALLGN